MKTINLLTLVMVIIGGLNWGFIGLADFDIISGLFGEGSPGSRIIFGLIGFAAVWQLAPFVKAFQIDEPRAEAAIRH